MRRPSILQGIQVDKDELRPVYGHPLQLSCIRNSDSRNMCMDLEQTRLQENTLQLAAAKSHSATLVVMGGMSVDMGVTSGVGFSAQLRKPIDHQL